MLHKPEMRGREILQVIYRAHNNIRESNFDEYDECIGQLHWMRVASFPDLSEWLIMGNSRKPATSVAPLFEPPELLVSAFACNGRLSPFRLCSQ